MSKKIKWEYSHGDQTYRADVDCLILRCTATWSSSFAGQKRSKWRWHCDVCVARSRKMRRLGPTRMTLARAKEDAIRMAGELLEDCRVGLDQATKTFEATVR